MVGRLLMALGGGVALLAVLAWSRSDSHGATETAVQRLPAAEPAGVQCFAVECARGTATIDLEFSPDASYDLIVSSLGHFGTTFQVAMESRPIEADGPETRAVAELSRIEAPAVHPIERCAGRLTEPRPASSSDDLDTGASTATLPLRNAPPNQLRQREFFLHVTDGELEDPRAYARVRSRLLEEGAHVRVYLDEQCRPADIAPALAGEIIRLLDDEIVPRSRQLIGEHRDIDGDGKLAVLLTPWLGNLRGGASTANGFVRGNDFEAGVPAPFSNHADVVYLNSNISATAGLKALLAHEYTHAACFSVRLANEDRPVRLPDEDDWLNEAIAHVAENLHGADFSNLADRIESYLAEPHKYPLVVRDYYRAGLWRNAGCRGATYLFLRWCTDRYGEGLLHALATNPVAGTRNLEWATGTPFPDLYRAWTLDLFESHVSALNTLTHNRSAAHSAGRPATITWHLDAAQELPIRGTATAFVKLQPGATTGRRRITLTTDASARLQITLVRRDRRSSRLAPY
jgi:hypothetical protein